MTKLSIFFMVNEQLLKNFVFNFQTYLPIELFLLTFINKKKPVKIKILNILSYSYLSYSKIKTKLILCENSWFFLILCLFSQLFIILTFLMNKLDIISYLKLFSKKISKHFLSITYCIFAHTK